jgi:hypothetical protein
VLYILVRLVNLEKCHSCAVGCATYAGTMPPAEGIRVFASKNTTKGLEGSSSFGYMALKAAGSFTKTEGLEGSFSFCQEAGALRSIVSKVAGTGSLSLSTRGNGEEETEFEF